MVDKIHLFILATFGESHEGGGLVELIFVVARKERERGREGGKIGREHGVRGADSSSIRVKPLSAWPP